MASKIDLISNALILIGDTPINSLTGGSRRETVANNLYDNIVQNELTKHRWGFARRQEQMSRLTDVPVNPNQWATIYQLPTDLLFLVTVSPDSNYQIYGDKVYSNSDGALFADYIANTPEDEWPVYFAKMIEYALAMDFAASIRDSSAARGEMAAAYVNASRMARFTDSQQYPTQQVRSNPFTNVRF
tara:strand:+ start:1468 stop:2028 length:561 start_codon:yes stop_codon:yes gene_type:complete